MSFDAVRRPLAAAALLGLATVCRGAQEAVRVTAAPGTQTTALALPTISLPLSLAGLRDLVGQRPDGADWPAFARTKGDALKAPAALAAAAAASAEIEPRLKRAVAVGWAETPVSAASSLADRTPKEGRGVDASARSSLAKATIGLFGAADRSLNVLFDNALAHHGAPAGPMPGVDISPAPGAPQPGAPGSIAPLLVPGPEEPHPPGPHAAGKIWRALKAGAKFINAGPKGWKGFTLEQKEAFKKTLSGVELIFMLLVTWYILYSTTNFAGSLLTKGLAHLIPATAGTVGSLAGKVLYFSSLLKLWSWIEFFIAYALFKASRFKPKFALLALPLIPWNLPEVVQLLGKVPYLGARLLAHTHVVFWWIPALLFFWPFLTALWARLRRRPRRED